MHYSPFSFKWIRFYPMEKMNFCFLEMWQQRRCAWLGSLYNLPTVVSLQMCFLNKRRSWCQWQLYLSIDLFTTKSETERNPPFTQQALETFYKGLAWQYRFRGWAEKLVAKYEIRFYYVLIKSKNFCYCFSTEEKVLINFSLPYLFLWLSDVWNSFAEFLYTYIWYT